MVDVRVGPSSIAGAGRGVFAGRRFHAGEIVEECHVIRIPQPQLDHLRPTVLWNYLFGFEDGSGDVGIALGFGSLYNHSEDANAEYVKDAARDVITISARRAIAPDEEITLGYHRPWLMRG